MGRPLIVINCQVSLFAHLFATLFTDKQCSSQHFNLPPSPPLEVFSVVLVNCNFSHHFIALKELRTVLNPPKRTPTTYALFFKDRFNHYKSKYFYVQ